MGWDYLGAILKGDITEHDIVVMVSLDSAQLYSNKESNCWIYVWVILNLPPDQRYKKLHVLPGSLSPVLTNLKMSTHFFSLASTTSRLFNERGFRCGIL